MYDETRQGFPDGAQVAAPLGRAGRRPRVQRGVLRGGSDAALHANPTVRTLTERERLWAQADELEAQAAQRLDEAQALRGLANRHIAGEIEEMEEIARTVAEPQPPENVPVHQSGDGYLGEPVVTIKVSEVPWPLSAWVIRGGQVLVQIGCHLRTMEDWRWNAEAILLSEALDLGKATLSPDDQRQLERRAKLLQAALDLVDVAAEEIVSFDRKADAARREMLRGHNLREHGSDRRLVQVDPSVPLDRTQAFRRETPAEAAERRSEVIGPEDFGGVHPAELTAADREPAAPLDFDRDGQ